MIHQRKILKAIAYAILLCFTSLTGAQPLYAIPANTQLPTGPGANGYGNVTHGVADISVTGNTMNIEQSTNTSVIQWDNFSIGADAAVNFVGKGQDNFNGFNSLNYVANGGPISEIYGQLTALGGNIFIANPAGVQIGNSAQINVGSLYVTNKDVGEAVKQLGKTSEESDIISAINTHGVAKTNAELMSLGAIVSTKHDVTFDGGRIIVDTDRLYANTGGDKLLEQAGGKLAIRTNDKDNVVLGYTGFDGETFKEKTEEFGNITVVDKDNNVTKQNDTVKGYMWVEDIDQLQRIAERENLDGWYALRNSIDANATAGKNFNPIGDSSKRFSGRFDGLGYSIFGLNVNVTNESDAAGLFGFATDAHIKNFTLNGGSISGGKYVGAAVGSASDSVIENITNTASVSGKGGKGDNGVGGIVGYAGNAEMSGLINIGTITGLEKSENVGGVVGYMSDGSLTGETYNLGSVTGGWNIGGIAGQMTNGAKIGNDGSNAFQIYNQLNVEGEYNVGGIAGFLGGVSSVEVGVNNGGDITATGARKAEVDAYAKERVRPIGGNELFNIGNIGGVVGYLFGDSAKIKNSGNRGTVHSAEIGKDVAVVPDTAKAANVGGVVGKIDTQKAADINHVKQQENNAYVNANVANSYNTGDVQGYTGVGGVAGMMYNGSIAGSYNLGTLKTTRQVDNSGGSNVDPLNMGGVVGDTTEETDASAVLYDVYNAGQIGDDTYTYYARHVGGVAGRLSGYIDKAYNTGNIYNRDTTVGGIVGWWNNGEISNVFNTGNITVRTNTEMQVGGIVGAASTARLSLSYAYNLGTIRGFQDKTDAPILVGGIIGRARGGYDTLIDNVYTLGNIYAAERQNDGTYKSVATGLGAIYGVGEQQKDESGQDIERYTPWLTNANYIKPEESGTDNEQFRDLSKSNGNDMVHVNVIEYDDRDDADKYELNAKGVDSNIANLNKAVNWSVNKGAWRLYEGGTPILNVFTPNMAKKDGWKTGIRDSGATVQYGTAYNPMLTIINLENASDKNVAFNWEDLGLYGAGGLAVYGGGLTLTDFRSAGDGRYFGGTIFSEGELNITGTGTNFNLGSASKLYGSSVKLNANGGDISAYGEVTSTNGNIEVSGKNVEIIGSLTAKADGKTTEIDGISGASTTREMDTTNLNDPNKAMKSVSDMFTYTTGEAGTNGDITVNASGAAEVLYGNLGTGSVSTAGNFTVNGGTTDGGKTFSGGSVYVDSDLSGTTGDINLSAGGEVLLDITNIAKANKSDEDKNGAVALHTFLDNHSNGKTKITLNSTNDDEIIAIDMWDNGRFDLDKYNDGDETFVGAIQALGEDLAGKTHIWISDANQLKGIQTGETTKILNYNFALKGNIDASALEDYKAIGGDEAYSGTFDGRDFRIIGLNADATKADEASSGIFGKLAGTVKDLRVYASKFFGGDGESVGAIASEVTGSGTITGVTTFGNTVTATNGAAGGIAGENSGYILESTASDSVSASGTDAYAGGVAGVNTGSIGEEGEAGESAQITADSAVRSGANGAAAIGGVVGRNETDGKVWLANSLGVTTGANAGSTGGIAGINSGTMTSLYNESIVTGKSNVGGVAGTNSGEIENAVNTTGITATGDYAGGLAGVNSGTIDSGRNTGTINGKDYVGGMVGKNEKADGTGGILKNLSNAVTAAIFGSANVGGIAGTNSGTITSDNNLVNEGTVYGNQYVGGIAGVNEQGGVIQNVTSETLVLKTRDDDDAKYFGGIAGQNAGTITDATNESNVRAEGATYVGGIAGQNTGTGKLTGSLVNNGDVTGLSNVGGLVGKNSNENLLVGNTDENGEITRLQVTNNGTVEATDGTAAGIVYEHDGNIMHADLINTGEVKGNTGGTAGGGAEHGSGGLFGIVKEGSIISDAALINRGTVTVTEGDTSSTGGVIGINHGKITNSTLINETAGGEGGVVEGGENTGGLIGKNTGNITYSSLINRVGAEVSGTENVGGLIGYNTGEIIGGRIDDSGKDLGLYTYKIYNNGTVSGATNVGGLIGHNADGGALDAGYNTGTVNGNDSVGGIAGQNDGSVSSVFNTIMTGLNEDGTTKYGAVTGKTNVGGIVGSNTGKLTNAYNTTTVTGGNGTTGNIAGVNTGNGIVEYVYAIKDADDTNNLVGDGSASNSYIFTESDNKANHAETYGDFGETIKTDAESDSIWRIYDGYSTPLLRVFLTDAKYKGSTNQFTYNATMQGIKDLQNVTAADGLNGSQISSIAEVLLTALEQKNADENYLAFSSTQIAANNSEEGFNPNNLGYDIDATFSIGKLLLSVKDIIASIVYGGSKYEVTGGVLEGVIEGDSVDIDIDFADMSKEELDKLIVEGSEYDKSKGGRATADVLYGDDGKVAAYENSLLYNGSLLLTGNDADNYALAEDTTVGGSITVEKATLNVELGTVERTYGNTDITTEGGYKVTDSFRQHLVNGDKNLGYAVSDFNVTVAENGDTALTGDSTGRVTKDANLENESYYWTAEKVSGVDGETLTNLSKNYDIVVNGQGKSIVNKAPLSITLKDVTRIYGDAETFVGGIGYGIDSVDGLVNGDEDYENALKLIDGAFENELIADSGLLPNGWTNDANDNNDEKPNYTWTVKDNNINAFEGIDKLSQNYTLTVNEGESFVEKLALTISDVFATIVYGDQNGTGFKIAEGGKLTGIVYDDDVSLSKELKIEDAEFAAGGSYESSRNGRTTADAGIYDNETLTFSDLTLSGTKAGNYTLNKDVEGDIVVEKAVLTLTPDNATTTYGTAFDENSYSYTLSGLTNDDEENALRTAIGVLEYGNDAAFDGEGGKYTADAATHNNAVYIKNLNEKTLTNYNVAQGDKGAAIITKATLDVALNPVERTYGDTALTDCDYSINTDWLDKLVNGDELMYTGDEISISGIISDKAVIDKYTTNDAGEHSWSAKVNASALAQNYNINEIAIGSSIVNKAKLTVNAGHAETTYGTPFDKNKYYYDLVGVTNGDSKSEIKAQIGNVAYDNTAAIEDGGDRVTDNAGVNGVLSILTDLFGIELGNYEIEKVNDGTATVEKADLFITAHDKHTHVGREPEYTGTTLGELELVNGDTLADFSYTFGIEEASMLDEAGHYAGTIAAVVDGQYYYDGTHDWSAHHDVFANYKVNVEAGNLTVVRLMPTIPHYNYSWLYDDAPYGRKWNFRERKAEIYFQDGGMAYDENM